jgi:hypothetical protein
MSGADKDKPDKPPNGNQQKFAWIYALGADTSLSAPAKIVATLTALKLAGHKGHFKATHKHIAALCGMNHRTVRRAVDELADQNYWDVGDGGASGVANTYIIWPPDERLELWLEAEKDFVEEWLDAQREYKRLCERWLNAEYTEVRKWLAAEKQFVTEWLDAEQQVIREWLVAELDAQASFEQRIFDIVVGLGYDQDTAYALAQRAWECHHETGAPFDDILQVIRDKYPVVTQQPDEPEMDSPPATSGQPPGHQWTAPWPPVDSPPANSDTLTSEDDHSHKSFKSVKTLKDSKGSPAARALNARCAGSPKTTTTCDLCYGTGKFLDGDGYVVVLLNDVDKEEYEVECQHSMAGNLAEIRRIEYESDSFWQIARTGYREIDSQYDHLRDEWLSDER